MAKSKKDEPCYTRTNKAGGTYVTCEGSQKGSSTKKAKSKISEKDKAGVLARRKAREEKAKKKSSAIGGSPPKGTKVNTGKGNPGKITTTTFPKKKPAQKKVAPKTDKYMERVKFVRANHPYGDTIAFVKINGQKYDWDGVNVKDGFGKKVAELKDPQLLERWFEGEIHKYNIPEVGKLIKDAPKKKPAQKKPAQKKPDPKKTAPQTDIERIGIKRDVKSDEVRFIKDRKEIMISGKDENSFIKRIETLSDFTKEYNPLSAAQIKKLLKFRGRNDIYFNSEIKNTAILITPVEFEREEGGRVITKILPRIIIKKK
jgi:hypothetical protein